MKSGNALKASKYVCLGSVFPAKFNGRLYCTDILIVCDNQSSKNVTQADLKRIEQSIVFMYPVGRSGTNHILTSFFMIRKHLEGC